MTRLTTLVLPLLIGGGLIIAISAIALNGGFSNIGEAINRKTKSQDRKDFELQKEMNEYNKSQRGLLENAYAFIFGEVETRKVSHPNQADPQPPLLGQQNQTKSQFEQSQTFPNYSKRGLRNG